MMHRILYFICLLVIGLTATDAITIIDNVTYGRISFFFMIFFVFFSPSKIIPNNDKYIKILLFFIVFVAVTMLFSKYIDIVFGRFLLLIQYLIIVITVGNVIITRKQIYNMLFAYSVGSVIIAFSMIYSYSSDVLIQTEQAYQIENVGNPNENAFLIVYAIIISFILLKNKVYKSNIIDLLLYIFIIIFILAIFSSASRMGFVLLMITVSIILISFPNLKFKNYFVYIISSIAIIYLVNNYITDKTLERLFNVTNDIRNSNLAGREVIWENAKNMITSKSFNWFVGEGWGSFPYAYQQFTGTFKGAHNFYISLFYSTGLIGCMIVLIYFINLFIKLLKYTKKEEIYFYLLLIVPLISMFSTNWEGRRWWFLMGLFIYKVNKLSKVEN